MGYEMSVRMGTEPRSDQIGTQASKNGTIYHNFERLKAIRQQILIEMVITEVLLLIIYKDRLFSLSLREQVIMFSSYCLTFANSLLLVHSYCRNDLSMVPWMLQLVMIRKESQLLLPYSQGQTTNYQLKNAFKVAFISLMVTC